jgi:hypothetical protein
MATSSPTAPYPPISLAGLRADTAARRDGNLSSGYGPGRSIVTPAVAVSEE